MTAIPAERLRPLIDRFEAENATSNRIHAGLARRLYRVKFEDQFVAFDVADRLLVDMDMPEEWHHELADLYELDAPASIWKERELAFSGSRLRAAIVLYERGGLSLPEIADCCWRQYGYSSKDACVQGIWAAMRRAGVRMRTGSEAKLIHWSRRTCAACGCAMGERTRGCQICTSRHYLRQKRGRGDAPAVIFNAQCSGCGCSYEDRSVGCRQCIDRHSHRRRRANCSACGCNFDRHTPGCMTCTSRAKQRRFRDPLRVASSIGANTPRRENSPDSAPVAGGGSLSAPPSSIGAAPSPSASPRRGAPPSTRRAVAA